jgi:hypothetical protein
VSGRRGSGSFGSGRTAGYAIGEDHPGWKPLQGSASDHVPGWAPSPCRLPGPVTRYGGNLDIQLPHAPIVRDVGYGTLAAARPAVMDGRQTNDVRLLWAPTTNPPLALTQTRSVHNHAGAIAHWGGKSRWWWEPRTHGAGEASREPRPISAAVKRQRDPANRSNAVTQ